MGPGLEHTNIVTPLLDRLCQYNKHFHCLRCCYTRVAFKNGSPNVHVTRLSWASIVAVRGKGCVSCNNQKQELGNRGKACCTISIARDDVNYVKNSRYPKFLFIIYIYISKGSLHYIDVLFPIKAATLFFFAGGKPLGKRGLRLLNLGLMQ